MIATFSQDPEPPYVRPLTAKEEKADFFAHHGKGKCNGVRYTVAREGDTYATMAFSLNVTERSLRENNDALGRDLKAGDRVYLSKKKSQAPKDHPFVWVGTERVHHGESVPRVERNTGGCARIRDTSASAAT